MSPRRARDALGRRVAEARAVAVVAALLLTAAASVASCSPAPPTPSGVPATHASPAAAASNGPSEPTEPPQSTAPTGSASAVVVDDTLLDALPGEIAGTSLSVDVETAADVAADVSRDAGLAADLEALAVGLYAGEADYAVVTVTRLRDGVFGEPFFRDWRDSFDEAVCAQAGGIDGHAEATLGGRTAFIGTCVGGVRTYHVRLSGPDRIVSLQALGDARYGELILAGLTE